MKNKNKLKKKAKIVEFGFGLQPTPEDKRDFSLGGIFGIVRKEDVPLTDWTVSEPLEIKNQGGTDMCTGYSLTSISEDQEGVTLDAGFTFAMIKKMQGDWRTWGGDLRSGCKVATKIGFLQVGDNPDDFGGQSRNYIANWNNWKLPLLLPKAEKHIKQSYFKVDGIYDVFDDIRCALWQHKDEKRSIYTGCVWQSNWTNAHKGIIPKAIMSGGVGHAFKVFGQKMINGEPYLMVQNSFGQNVGDNGIYYFPRSVVNAKWNFGAYMFKDMPKEQAQQLNGLVPQTGIKVIGEKPDTYFNRLCEVLKNLIKKI